MEKDQPDEKMIRLSIQNTVWVYGKLSHATVSYYRTIILECHRSSNSKRKQRELARTLENEHEVRAHFRSCPECMRVARQLITNFFHQE